MQLPSDPIMLMSVINTMLRDKYASLDMLCEDIDVSRENICQKLADAGYEYNSEMNKFFAK